MLSRFVAAIVVTATAAGSVAAQGGVYKVPEVTLKSVQAEISGDTVIITTASGAVVRVKRSDIVTSAPTDTTSPKPLNPGGYSMPALESRCAAESPRDFAMQAYCVKRQRDAAASLAMRTMYTPERKIAREECEKEHPIDFAMRNYCEERQMKALDALGK